MLLLHYFYPVESVDLLNAVWDSQLGICYSIMECSCGRTVGINIHYVTENNNFLVGKVIVNNLYHFEFHIGFDNGKFCANNEGRNYKLTVITL